MFEQIGDTTTSTKGWVLATGQVQQYMDRVLKLLIDVIKRNGCCAAAGDVGTSGNMRGVSKDG
jgi:hypothetical protein